RPHNVGDDNNAVKVIGHDYEFIQINIWEMDWNIIPTLAGNISRIVQSHFAADDFPKQACPVVGADGHKIGPGLGIIVTLQADGTAISLWCG
ncbi:MAG: hypothetical protein GX945_04640, partial [Lentisphaerae bacterium]|nr:hypothetical protein [Lentisphaerota bacterium]